MYDFEKIAMTHARFLRAPLLSAAAPAFAALGSLRIA
jgi:hypothetical protein